jgi:hypothetical protein
MSAVGAVSLLYNIGKQDSILNNVTLLYRNIASETAKRQSSAQYLGRSSVPPVTFATRTHIVYTTSTFKPFVPIGIDYAPVQPQTNASWGGDYQFVIQQTGDFFADMGILVKVTAPVLSGGLPSLTSGTLGTTTASAGNANLLGVVPAVTFQWVNDVGLRIFEKYQFTINGTVIDQYTKEALIFMKELHVPVNKRSAFNRLIGQQMPMQLTLEQSMAPVLGTNQLASPDSYQVSLQVSAGYQTPVAISSGVTYGASSASVAPSALDASVLASSSNPISGLNLFIPLKFWFNEDIGDSIASCSISQGQRYITCTLTSQYSNLFQINYPVPLGKSNGTSAAPGVFFDARFPAGLQYSAVNTVQPPTVSATLIVNNIYMDPQVVALFVQNVQFNLVRLHTTQIIPMISSTAQSLSSFKWPLEYLMMGVRPSSQSAQATDAYGWEKFHQVVPTRVALPNSASSLGLNLGSGTPAINEQVQSSVPMYGYCQLPKDLVSSISISTNGQDLWRVQDALMYNSYIPYRYGGYGINAPDDRGAFMANFGLDPSSHQPNGHINISRLKDFSVVPTLTAAASSLVSGVDLVCVGSTINFAVISEGNMVIRYAN